MILRNSFYNVREENMADGLLSATIDIIDSHEVFKGHFPSQPIVPGVFQMQLIKELLAQSTNSSLSLNASKEIKFIRPISPEVFKGLEVVIRIKDQSESQLSFSAQIKNSEAVFLKYRGTYKVHAH